MPRAVMGSSCAAARRSAPRCSAAARSRATGPPRHRFRQRAPPDQRSRFRQRAPPDHRSRFRRARRLRPRARPDRSLRSARRSASARRSSTQPASTQVGFLPDAPLPCMQTLTTAPYPLHRSGSRARGQPTAASRLAAAGAGRRAPEASRLDVLRRLVFIIFERAWERIRTRRAGRRGEMARVGGAVRRGRG